MATVEQPPPDATTGTAEAGARYDRLKPNAIGLAGVLFMVVATAAPITAMTGNVPLAVGYGNGTGAPAGFLFATIVLTIFSVGYVTMARYITATGAFYGFISHGLGREIGMASGLLAVLAYVVFEASIIGIFAAFATTTFSEQLGLDVPWQVFAFGMLALNAVLAFFDINVTARILGVLLITEISILALMAVAVLVQGGGPDGIPLEPLSLRNAFTGPAAGFGLFFAFWSWVGFESTAMYGEESRNPKKIVPQATLIAVVGIGLFYIFVSWMAVAGNGLQQSVDIAAGDAPFDLFFAPTREFVGGWAVTVFQWLILTGSFACGFAFHNCASRYLYAFGREGFVWRGMGRTHPGHGSPYVASSVQSVIAGLIIVAFWVTGQDPYIGLYGLMAILGTFAILVVQTLCSFAVIGYFQRHRPEARHWFRTLVAPLVGGLGMAVVVYLLVANLESAAGDAADTLLFSLIPWIIVGTFVIGVGIALYMKSRMPERYQVIGRVVFEEADARPEIDADGDGRGDDHHPPVVSGRSR